ncbi:hypothetical protein SAMN06265222_1542 [Neorhodopirellula lusitana]|uniref:Uncharacterized protein n=1 Tax=Neorhodopirellula lusitana TaxID=445327 RepID=A0ABY1QTG4_9BACT|nr:hypothetical protein SAMN06265222_1542 [Neorhodopirellula lusitana]
MTQTASNVQARRRWSDLLSFAILVPAVVAILMGHLLLGAFLWLTAAFCSLWIRPRVDPSLLWGAAFGVPMLFAGALATVIAIPIVYLLAPVLLPLAWLRERWNVRRCVRSACPNCGRAYGTANVESAIDTAYTLAFDATGNPMDASVACIVLTCESCGMETELAW